MGRRKLSIAAELVTFMLREGLRVCGPQEPIRNAQVIDARFRDPSVIDLLLESNEFEGGEHDTLENAQPVLPVFTRAVKLWVAWRGFGVLQMVRGVFDSLEAAEMACVDKHDWVGPLTLNSPRPISTSGDLNSPAPWEQSYRPKFVGEIADDADRHGEVPGA